MLCVSIRIVGAIWYISSCVSMVNLLAATLICLLGFLFLLIPLALQLATPLELLQVSFVLLFPYALHLMSPLEVFQDLFFEFFTPWSWCLVLLLYSGLLMHYWCVSLVLFDFHLPPPSIIYVGWLLLHNFWNDIKWFWKTSQRCMICFICCSKRCIWCWVL